MSYTWIIPIFVVLAAFQLYDAYKKIKMNKGKNDMNVSINIMVDILTVLLIMPLVYFIKKVEKGSFTLEISETIKMLMMVILFFMLYFVGYHLRHNNRKK